MQPRKQNVRAKPEGVKPSFRTLAISGKLNIRKQGPLVFRPPLGRMPPLMRKEELRNAQVMGRSLTRCSARARQKAIRKGQAVKIRKCKAGEAARWG